MKNWFYFLMLLVSMSVQAKANWSPLFMDHERFVHLSEQDKEQVIIKTMELFVEMEGNYQKEMKTSGYSEERFKKFQKFVKSVQNFIINSAHAAGTPESKTAAALVTNFTQLLKGLKSGDTCIYGGFISVYLPLYEGQPNGKKVCTHPGQIQGQKISKDDKPAVQEKKKAFNELVTKVKAAYVGNNSEQCPEPDTISCNPLVFGYKKNNTDGFGVPFCVSTGNKGVDMPKGKAATSENLLNYSKAHNVSFNCMKKALTESPDADTLESRMNHLKGLLASNPDIVKELHKFIFDTCVCGSDRIFNSGYVDYIKPHRTCYGMMNTLREMNNQCALYTPPSNAEFAKKWNEYYTEEGSQKQLGKTPKNVKFDEKWDEAYKNMINDDYTVKTLCNSPKGEVIPVEPIKPVVPTNQIKGCNLEISKSAESDTVTVVVIYLGAPTEEERKTLKWSEGGNTDPAKPNHRVFTAAAEEIKVSATLEVTEADGKKVTKNCKEAIIPKKAPATTTDEGKEPGIKAELESETATHTNIIAKITDLEGKEIDNAPEGYQIVWSHGGVNKDVADKAEKPSDSAPSTKVKTEGEDTDTPTDSHGNTNKISEKRLSKSYEACAKLVPSDTTKKTIEGGCVAVKPVREAPAPYVPGPRTPPPQFFVPPQNTRTDGIF